MKRLIILIIFSFPFNLFGQWNDNFSTGNLMEWRGDTNSFIVNTREQLQLMSPTAGEKFIYREFSNDLSLEWKFYQEMQFAPSSSNKLKIYLAMDDPNPT
ncbi:MAG: hypothetical protein ABIO44_14415, partial [Saprospiraceae bacterium]